MRINESFRVSLLLMVLSLCSGVSCFGQRIEDLLRYTDIGLKGNYRFWNESCYTHEDNDHTTPIYECDSCNDAGVITFDSIKQNILWVNKSFCTNQFGYIEEYQYDSAHNLVKDSYYDRTDSAGSVLLNTYADGKLVQQLKPGRDTCIVKITYNRLKNQKITSYYYKPLFDAIFGYSPILKFYEKNGVETITYNLYGQVTEVQYIDNGWFSTLEEFKYSGTKLIETINYTLVSLKNGTLDKREDYRAEFFYWDGVNKVGINVVKQNSFTAYHLTKL